MSVSDWSTLAVAVLTFFGLLVAAFTFYRSLGSRADLELSMGDELILHYTQDHRLILTATFVLINKGSLPGTVTQLSAHMHSQAAGSPTVSKSLVWRFYEETTTTRDPQTGRVIRFTGSSDPVYPLVVPGRAAGSSSAVSKIRLYEGEGSASRPGRPVTFEPLPRHGAHYLVTFSIQPGTRARGPRDYACVLEVADEHARTMQDLCTEVGGKWEQRLIFRRKRGFGSAEQGPKIPGGIFESKEFRAGY